MHLTKRNMNRSFLAALLFLGSALPAFAQRNLTDIPDPDPEEERRTFILPEGFEVNLYAADPMLAKPIQMNFDAAGRLWVASSEVYPQIEPGQVANDKILVLEDTDHDGRADKTVQFAAGLLIPTGVEPGDGGCYVANSTELVHLIDTDGDLQADQRRVLLSGFGTEDTHHILHTLRWGPEGLLYMNQSIYIHSHVETPYGVRRMNGSGIWHFRPETAELETYMLGLVNPWGHHFTQYGTSFATDGAGGDGINYVFPGFVGITSPGAKRVLRGLNPGSPKHCGLEIVDSTHLPEEWRGSLITNDFRAHRVCRFEVTEDGSGYVSREQQELIRSSHVAFRPVDVKQGPDGAIYIADWYNPIIQHGEVDFRDPRRDHVHGRIWRVTAQGRPLVEPPDLSKATIDQLLLELRSPNSWTRHQAKRQLKERGYAQKDAVTEKLAATLATIDKSDAALDDWRLELLWTYQSLDVVAPELLRALLHSANHNIRAAATRVVYHWHDRLPGALELLAERIIDEHPRVRLEAARALSRVRDPRSIEIAMRALDLPQDKYLDFALWTTARDLKGIWLPALEAGVIDFDGNVQHLTFTLQAAESPHVVDLLLAQATAAEIDPEQEAGILSTLAALADQAQLGELFQAAADQKLSADRRANLLNALAAAAERRNVRPNVDRGRLLELLHAESEALQRAALSAAGAWRREDLVPEIARVAAQGDAAAIRALANINSPASLAQLQALLAAGSNGRLDLPGRTVALAALARVKPAQAAELFAADFEQAPANADPSGVVRELVGTRQGPQALAAALAEKKLPADVAKLCLRTVRSSGQSFPELEAAIIAAGNLQEKKSYTPAEIAALLTDIAERGAPQRGQAVYRRHDMACQKCHPIGGAGGRVGPDLLSLGASAQPDYLLESLLEPGKKIKENYHSLVVATIDGQVISGVKIRETDSELILRNAEDREVRIPLDDIDFQRDGGSLMPVGLVDPLTREELVDLVAFLSALGKEGPFALSKERVVRRWQVVPPTPENFHKLTRSSIAAVVTDPGITWEPAYSTVAGELPLGDLPRLKWEHRQLDIALVRFELEVSTPGKAAIHFGDLAGLSLWVDGQPREISERTEFAFGQGRHTFTLTVDYRQRSAPLRIELQDVQGSKAQAALVGGK